MTSENDASGQPPPQPTVIDVEAEPAPTSAPVARAMSKRTLALLGAAALLALVVVGFFLTRRPPQKLQEAPPPVAETPAPATVTLPLPDGPQTSPHAAPATPAGKIFNNMDALKDAAKGAADAPAAPGTINELPPPPKGFGGNDALQDAAKEAAKTPPAEIDLSNPEAALRSLEDVAAQSAAASPPAETPSPQPAAAPADNAAALDVARLQGSLEEQRQHTERQAAEIARLNAEIARLENDGGPAARRARAAILFAALEEKAKSGAPFRREYDAYAAVAGGIGALAPHAEEGLATPRALGAQFEPALKEALIIARRAGAGGPLAKLSANFAAMINLRPAGPRKGDDAIAILSRADAAAREGDLAAALAETAALDAVTRAPFAKWEERARARLAADAALAAAGAASLAALEAEAVR